MIASLRGRVAERFDSSAIIEVAGIGYHVWMAASALSELPVAGDEVSVFTHLHVREDELALYAFPSYADLQVFERLITVSGVGPRVALAILSAMSAGELASAILSEDIATLTSVPGVGKKTAQRMCLELRDKIGQGEAGAIGRRSASAAIDEATAALLAMGFSPAEVSAALKGYTGEDGVQSIVRHGLERLGSAR